MTERQQDMIVNVGIEIGITIAGLGLAALNKYLREQNEEAQASLSPTKRRSILTRASLNQRRSQLAVRR